MQSSELSSAGSGYPDDDLVFRLIRRAEIRRNIATRKSVRNNEPDRISDLLEESALEIHRLRVALKCMNPTLK